MTFVLQREREKQARKKRKVQRECRRERYLPDGKTRLGNKYIATKDARYIVQYPYHESEVRMQEKINHD